jgi:phospholipid/cholesterol/gamma-HCH transport system permease protein
VPAPAAQPPTNVAPEARASARADSDELTIEVGGRWQLRAARPNAHVLLGATYGTSIRRIAVAARDLAEWDSSLLLFVLNVRIHAADRGLACTTRGLPPVFDEWLARLEKTGSPTLDAAPEKFPLTRRLGRWAQTHADQAHEMLAFLGECVLGAGRVLAHPGGIRWADYIFQMRRCGAQALGIVGLITFLVGVILAFVAAVLLRTFGADIYVANFIGIAIVREMGPMMAAIVLAGRTGAAFAAELGNMRLNEEIDALETFGLRPHDFLVMPRLIALVLMTPLLTLYANFLGVVGGMVVAQLVVDVPPIAFFHQLQSAVSLKDLGTGLLKSVFFGVIIAYAGCLRGMKAERSAIGVGEATTAAVVLALLFIIEADAVFTIVFNALGW